ncbi:MAG: DUF2993 domain-containing protein [Leptolyngbyaceae cyanobacterium bins.59]|nr:DUF2993 domain-containing protein [Leptolyngbyaceae cyanobacterium bins.59]
MEVVTVLFTGLIALITPAGYVVDRGLEGAIRSQFKTVEQLQVRVDNAPSYQIIQGKADRVRIAGRGLFPIPELRIAALELELDRVELDPSSLGQRPRWTRPLQAGVRVVLTQTDLNQALRSPALTAQLRNLAISLPNFPQAQQVQRYDFLNPQVTFLHPNRFRFQVEFQEQGFPDKLLITLEASINVVAGSQIQITDPIARVNNELVPDRIVNSFVNGVNQQFDLRRLEISGLTVRVLKFNLKAGQEVELAAFVRAEANQMATLLTPP